MSEEPLAFWNGSLVPYARVGCALHDAGFVYGATITDFCRTYKGLLFRWADHLRRFRHDCASVGITLRYSDGELTDAAEELIRHQATLTEPGAELALITVATPGPIGFMSASENLAFPSVGMHTFPLPRERYRRFFEHGVDLAVVPGDPADPLLLPAQIKHRSRLHWWLADRYLRTRGEPAGTLAVLSDRSSGRLTETAIGSLLAVRDGVVTVPDRTSILASVSLQVVEELCEELGIPFAESRHDPSWHHPAEELFLCGTAFGLAGVRSLKEVSGLTRVYAWPGPILTRLSDRWSERVGVDFRHQFLRNW